MIILSPAALQIAAAQVGKRHSRPFRRIHIPSLADGAAAADHTAAAADKISRSRMRTSVSS